MKLNDSKLYEKYATTTESRVFSGKEDCKIKGADKTVEQKEMTWNNQNCAEKGAKITLLALYEKTIYQNEKNGFCIFRMTSEDTGIPKELGYGRDHKSIFL